MGHRSTDTHGPHPVCAHTESESVRISKLLTKHYQFCLENRGVQPDHLQQSHTDHCLATATVLKCLSRMTHRLAPQPMEDIPMNTVGFYKH